VQRAPRAFELKVVWSDPEAGTRAAQEVAAGLRTILHRSAVDVITCDELPDAPGSKFRHLVPLRLDGA
jgi:hypothetical protein